MTWGVNTKSLPPGLSLPQLILLDEAAFVFVQNVEHFLHIIRALFLQTHHLEEPFVVEGVCSCWGEEGVKEGWGRVWGKSGKGVLQHLLKDTCIVVGTRGAEGAQLGKDATPKVITSWLPHTYTEEPHRDCRPPESHISMKPILGGG